MRAATLLRRPCLEYDLLGRDVAHGEDVRPAEGKVCGAQATASAACQLRLPLTSAAVWSGCRSARPRSTSSLLGLQGSSEEGSKAFSAYERSSELLKDAQPLRTTMHFFPWPNWRATASMPNCRQPWCDTSAKTRVPEEGGRKQAHRAGTGNHDGRVRLVDGLERAGNVVHALPERLRHPAAAAVGVRRQLESARAAP